MEERSGRTLIPVQQSPTQSAQTVAEARLTYLEREVSQMKDEYGQDLAAMREEIRNLRRQQNMQSTAKMNTCTDTQRADRAFTSLLRPGPSPQLTENGLGIGSLASQFGRRINAMLTEYGRLEAPQKLMILQFWMLLQENIPGRIELLVEITSVFLQELLLASSLKPAENVKAKIFLRSRDQMMELQLKDLFREIIAIIPDHEWLAFSRVKLGIEECVISDVKRTCQLTPELLDQLFAPFLGDGQTE